MTVLTACLLVVDTIFHAILFITSFTSLSAHLVETKIKMIFWIVKIWRHMDTIRGDICNAKENYILQQCNCLTVRPHGLSQTLAERFPHGDVYGNRVGIGRRNCAIPEHRSTPGTVEILEGIPNIVCLYGQYKPGKPGSFSSYPDNFPDGRDDRVAYFESGLKALSEFLPEGTRIAVPYKIGCGLGGGDWKTYLPLLEQFGEELKKTGGGVTMYRL